MNISAWFHIPIAHYDFNGKLLADIQAEIQTAISKINKAELGSPWGDKTASTFNFSSKINDIETYNMVNLKNAIYESVSQFFTKLNYKGNMPALQESWLNFSGNKGFQFDHKHPNCKISGCYYYQTTGDDGSIRFENPNPYALAGGFPFDNINADAVLYKPQVGRLILFPSWLTHRVTINNTNNERISLAFNLHGAE